MNWLNIFSINKNLFQQGKSSEVNIFTDEKKIKDYLKAIYRTI